jgi:hypothetical protein
MRINFLGQKENPELLLPSASDRVWVGAIAEDRRPRLDDERLAGFNQSADLSTYPRKISVRTSRATALVSAGVMILVIAPAICALRSTSSVKCEARVSPTLLVVIILSFVGVKDAQIMSVGTAMVIVATGVFFYLKPAILKVTAKWTSIALGVGALSFGGWYFYHLPAKPIALHFVPDTVQPWEKYPVVILAPPCMQGKVYPNTVDSCAPWDRKWSKTDTLKAGSIVEDNGTITSAEQSRAAMAALPAPPPGYTVDPQPAWKSAPVVKQ